MMALVLFFGMNTHAFAASDIALEIAIDASKSMNAELDGEPRIDIAKRVITETLSDLDADIALRAFGHNVADTTELKEQSCLDTELEVGFGNDFSEVVTATNALTPLGWTPLALTIKEAGADLLAQVGKKPILVILSDGEDTCGGDPVAEAAKLKEMDIDVALYIIGFAVDAETKIILENIAQAGGGQYLEANDANGLMDSLETILENEQVAVKTPEDVIETTGAENKLTGGSTFDNAVDFPLDYLGKEFSTQNLPKGANETFKLQVKKGQKLKLTIRTGEEALVDNELTTKGTPHGNISVFNAKKVSVDSLRVSKPFTEVSDTITIAEDGTLYLFVGPASNSSYGAPSTNIYIVDFEQEKPFNDVEMNDPYFDAITYLKELGVVVGYSDGSYGVNSKINRAEFLKILMEVAKKEGEVFAGSNCYPDVKDEWFAPYVCSATVKGIVNGYPDGTFGPNKFVNFVEAAKIVVNVFAYTTTPGGEWFRPFVNALANLNAIPVSIIDLEQEITRGQMAEIMFRLRGGVSNRPSNNTL